MKLVVTIYEETVERAIEAIGALRQEHDMVEVRAERFVSIDLRAIRAVTAKPVILTYRGQHVARSIFARALEAGIDYVDVEWREGIDLVAPERTVLSHHDYDGMRDVERIMKAMRGRHCAFTKLAATPRSFADNERLLALLPGTVIGMGEGGLYSRILAPFKGAELSFVAGSHVAAPAQLTLERALEIFGRGPLHADRVFAVVGNPAGHSLSPSIHNRLFREKGVPAAYTIASLARFEELEEPFLRGEPCGLSVTAPFKEDALRFAMKHGGAIAENASAAQGANTLVNLGGRILADNTDVDGFSMLISSAQKAAIIGAGATARAARVALDRAGIPSIHFNRTPLPGVRPLQELSSFDGDLIINTLPSGVEVPIPPCRTYIEAAYGGAKRETEAEHRIGGLALLEAQAMRQHALFMKVFDES